MAPPRAKQYLDAEIAHVQQLVLPEESVLELGCGYGRVLERLAGSCGTLVGIDLSWDSLRMAQRNHALQQAHILQMDAGQLGFEDDSFDTVLCIQNGISAFGMDPNSLIGESVRVTRPGGVCIFSSYSDSFWEDRLEWFRIQAENGLIGEIDWTKTRDGEIVCKDGFKSTTYNRSDFDELIQRADMKAEILEIDQSSLFLEMRP
jgi:2-polyprenyl-6-hydroxyphenyl methylase/3-demethylubiquinone-9 3-methyltransferase